MWPFKKRKDPPPQEVWQVAPQAWRDVPPLRRVIADPPVVNPVQRFSDTLAAWQDPTFLAPLGHRLTPEEPAGVVHDLVTPTIPSAPDMPVRSLPVAPQPLQRSAVMPATQPTVPETPAAPDTPAEGVPDVEATADEPSMPLTLPEPPSETPATQAAVDAPTLGPPPSTVDSPEPVSRLVEPLSHSDVPDPEHVNVPQDIAYQGVEQRRRDSGPDSQPLVQRAMVEPSAQPLVRTEPLAADVLTLGPPPTADALDTPLAPRTVQRAELVFQRRPADEAPVRTVGAEPIAQREPEALVAPLLGATADSSGPHPSGPDQSGAVDIVDVGNTMDVASPASVRDTVTAKAVPAVQLTPVQRSAVQTRRFEPATQPITQRLAPPIRVVPVASVAVAAPVQRTVVSSPARNTAYLQSVQRDVDSPVESTLAQDLIADAPTEPPPSPEPMVTPEAAPTPAAAPSGGAAEPEELLKTLFDPLLRKLRTELRLDRERRGVVTDMSRW